MIYKVFDALRAFFYLVCDIGRTTDPRRGISGSGEHKRHFWRSTEGSCAAAEIRSESPEIDLVTPCCPPSSVAAEFRGIPEF